jgi:hypothetical protein
MSDSRRMNLQLLVLIFSIVPLAAAHGHHGSGGGHSGGSHSFHSRSPASQHSGHTTTHGIRHFRHVRKRSRAARHDFMSQHPCPATGRTNGRCPGYVVDHVNPLECGGADSPSNMQWQTVAAGKTKDKTEGRCL